MSGFTIREMIIAGWPVLSVLFVMSILSVTVIVDRYMTFRRAHLDAGMFAAKLADILERQGVVKALEFCGRFGKPAAMVAAAALSRAGKREDRERAARHAMQAQIATLESYVPILGTVAAVAPFIGLLGTVLGIIKSFRDLAMNIGGGPSVVAAGVAESLITTAVGLFVAIPAVIAYNYFIRRIHRLTDEIDQAVYEIVEVLERKGGAE